MDSTGDVGKYSAIGIDQSVSPNVVHISYHDDSNDDLVYATKVVGTGAWTIDRTLDTGTAAGLYTSLAVDSSGGVHISFISNRSLRYATNSTGVWRVGQVRDSALGRMNFYTSIALDSSDAPHFIYNLQVNYANAQYGELRYAYSLAWDSGNNRWNGNYESVDGDGIAPGGPRYVGKHNALAIDLSDVLHVAYTDDVENNGIVDFLYYRSGTFGAWGAVEQVAAGDMLYPSIAVDSATGNVFASYNDNGNQDFLFRTRTAAWGAAETIADTGNVGQFSAMTFDGMHFSYADLSNGYTMYAKKDSWSINIADTGKNVDSTSNDQGDAWHLDLYVNGIYKNCASTGGSSSDALDLSNGGNPVNESIGVSQILSLDTGHGNDWKALQPGYVGPDQRLDAVIDEVRFWSVPKSAAELLQCLDVELGYDASACAIDNTKLKGYWRFNNGSGLNVPDISGTGNHGRKTYCDDSCADFTATTIEWNGGWTQGYPYKQEIGTETPQEVNFTLRLSSGAMIDGTVHDEHGSQVEGAIFYARMANAPDPAFKSLMNGGFTDNSGQVQLKLVAGDWNVGTCMNCHGHPTNVGGQEKLLVPPAEDLVTLSESQTLQHTLEVYYADGAVGGTVFEKDGITPVPSGYIVEAFSKDALNGAGQTSVGPIRTKTETDVNGDYSLPLLGGTWTVFSHWMGKNNSETRSVTITTDGDEVLEPGETVTGINFSLQSSLSNTLPIAVSDGPYVAIEGDSVTLDASASSDPDGNIVQYAWDINRDGTIDSTDAIYDKTWIQNGILAIGLRVTDDKGATSEMATTATISDTSPTADFSGTPTSGMEPLTVNFANSSTGYDQPLTYEWDFDYSGGIDSTAVAPSYDYATAGTYSVKLTVTDSDGSINSLLRTDYIITSSCILSAARIDGAIPIYFNFIQSAYDSAINSDTLQLRDVTFAEDLLFDFNKSLLIQGGYDCNYATNTGNTTINGNVAINSGSVTMENLVIE